MMVIPPTEFTLSNTEYLSCCLYYIPKPGESESTWVTTTSVDLGCWTIWSEWKQPEPEQFASARRIARAMFGGVICDR